MAKRKRKKPITVKKEVLQAVKDLQDIEEKIIDVEEVPKGKMFQDKPKVPLHPLTSLFPKIGEEDLGDWEAGAVIGDALKAAEGDMAGRAEYLRALARMDDVPKKVCKRLLETADAMQGLGAAVVPTFRKIIGLSARVAITTGADIEDRLELIADLVGTHLEYVRKAVENEEEVSTHIVQEMLESIEDSVSVTRLRHRAERLYMQALGVRPLPRGED